MICGFVVFGDIYENLFFFDKVKVDGDLGGVSNLLVKVKILEEFQTFFFLTLFYAGGGHRGIYASPTIYR